jgi:hypothetical protein
MLEYIHQCIVEFLSVLVCLSKGALQDTEIPGVREISAFDGIKPLVPMQQHGNILRAQLYARIQLASKDSIESGVD